MSQQDAVDSAAERQLPALPDDFTRVLCVVAHPDDLEYGAAAAIAEWTDAGREVTYLLATRGEAGIDTMAPAEAARVREAEQRASAAVVGVEAVEFLAYRDGVIEEGLPLRRDIAEAIRRHRPELVVTLNHHDSFFGTYWNTPDHRAVGRATLDAVGDAGNRWIFADQLSGGDGGEGGLEPWDGVRRVAVSAGARMTHAVAVSPGAEERAIASLAEHRAYIKALEPDADPETYAREFLTQQWGSVAERFGGRRGVAFEVYPC